MSENRWDKCIVHYDSEVTNFFDLHFKDPSRRCFLIGGAGFDPRSSEFSKQLSIFLKDRLEVHLIKEERPSPDTRLSQKADEQLKKIKSFCKNTNLVQIKIFSDDNAVIGGRQIIQYLSNIKFYEYTDIIIDMSALSIGISFPIASFIYNFVKDHNKVINVHLTVLSNPQLDSIIKSSPSDRVTDIRGFNRRELFGEDEKARLWIPQLSENKKGILRKIHTEIDPHDTCPVLPFPSEDPLKGDRIASSIFSFIQTEWGGPLDNEWDLDPRNFVYADERKPLDIYRTILKIDDERKPVFETFGGSILILSPLGGKIPTVGALMAALERNFPVVYVETLEYIVDWEHVSKLESYASQSAHIWLYGEAYLRDIEEQHE